MNNLLQHQTVVQPPVLHATQQQALHHQQILPIQDFRNNANLVHHHQNTAAAAAVAATTTQITRPPVIVNKACGGGAAIVSNPKEEPMTEVKRVPYRITHNEEGDMFEDFSCSSDFEKICAVGQANQASNKIGQGLLFGAEEERRDVVVAPQLSSLTALNLNI